MKLTATEKRVLGRGLASLAGTNDDDDSVIHNGEANEELAALARKLGVEAEYDAALGQYNSEAEKDFASSLANPNRTRN